MISIIIPCHNEEAVLPAVFDRVTAAAADWTEEWEVLLVDDGSCDRTWDLIQQFHRADARWRGLALARNFGQQAALGAGLEHAAGDVIVLLDADLQDPPEAIGPMLEKWHEGFDVVYGIRTRRPEGWLKRTCYALFYRVLARAAAVTVPEDAGDFCLMDRRVVDVLRACREQRPFWRGLRSWTGFRQTGLVYPRGERAAGQSQYTFRKLVRLAIDGWFCLTPSPLHGLTVLGLLALVAALGGGAVWLAAGADPAGTAVLGWAILLLGAVQLLGLGLVGAYLARIHDDVRGRPRWVVADTVGLPPRRRRRTGHAGQGPHLTASRRPHPRGSTRPPA